MRETRPVKKLVDLFIDFRVDMKKLNANMYSALFLTTAGSVYEHPQIFEMLVHNRANVIAADEDGLTALMNACYAGHARSVFVLFVLGRADPTAKMEDGFTALMFAAQEL